MKKISSVKEILDGVFDVHLLLFLVVERLFRVKVIESNYVSSFGLDYPTKCRSVIKYLESN